MEPVPAKRPKKSVYIRVRDDGSMICADAFSQQEMRRRKIKRGDLLRAYFSKPRDYSQWKKAHALGTLLIRNVEEFWRFADDKGNEDAHAALKHLQRLSGIECEDAVIAVAGQEMLVRTPLTLAFEEMDETRFQAAYAAFCAHVKNVWWPDLDQASIEQMASLLGESSA